MLTQPSKDATNNALFCIVPWLAKGDKRTEKNDSLILISQLYIYQKRKEKKRKEKKRKKERKKEIKKWKHDPLPVGVNMPENN